MIQKHISQIQLQIRPSKYSFGLAGTKTTAGGAKLFR